MYLIDVYAAFDFINKEVKVGTMEYDRIKGSPSYRFSFDEQFLTSFPAVKLSAELGRFPGVQSSPVGLFGCFSDALPDRWGRALIDKREQIKARKENRISRQFDEFGYLVRIDDSTRMGAFRFKYNGNYLGLENSVETVPPLASLPDFIRDAQELERAEMRGEEVVRDEWLDNVWKQGSSLGGARPKANILDDGHLWIAKIPSVKDTYDVALWEHFACTLAAKCGIKVAESKIIRIGPTPYHTLLSKRFDRDGERRVHFASSLTVTGLKDGDNAQTNKGYIDIADAITGDIGVRNPNDNLEELYRRIAFNIIIGNHDDHFRNHGFLLRKDGWELSPAYDLNPTNALTQVLMISNTTNRSSLKDLLDASEFYLISKYTAREVVSDVFGAAVNWRAVAKDSGISNTEMDRFARRIQYALDEFHPE